MGMTKEYIEKMDVQLKKWDADFEALAAEGRQVALDAREGFYERIKTPRVGRNAAQKSFREFRTAADAAGADMHAGMEAAWESMRKALEKASAELRK